MCADISDNREPPAVPISVEGLEEAMDELQREARKDCDYPNDANLAAARSSLKAIFSKLVEGRDAALADVDEMDTNDVLQVLCRVFDDGADQGMEEWFAWYKPEQWFHSARALGAFIYTRLKPERDELSALRSEVARLTALAIERANRADFHQGQLADARVEFERLSADRLTQKQSAYLIELVELHAFSGRLRDESLLALRRLSEQGENQT